MSKMSNEFVRQKEAGIEHPSLGYQPPHPIGSSDPDPEPRQHYEVHCGKCNWWGMISQMRVIYKPNPSKPGDVMPELGCPMCESDQWLEYEEYSIGRLEKAIVALEWAELDFKRAMDKLRETVHCQISQ